MRICFAVRDLNSKAGWGRQTASIVEKLRSLGHQVGYISEKSQKGGETLKLPNSSFLFRRPLQNLIRIIRIRFFLSSYDVVICYDIKPYAVILSLATIGQKNKIIIHALGTYSLFSGNKIKDILMAYACRRAHRVYFVSDFTKRQVENSGYKFTESKILPVGVDTGFFQKKTTRPLLQSPYIITVGALKNRKGQHLSLTAFCEISSRYPDIKYILIGSQGDSFYFEKLKKIVSDYGVEDKVLFLSDVGDSDLLSYYNSALFFIMTSTTTKKSIEGFGMVYLEAAACGKTAIGAINSGAEAAIDDGVSGLLVEPKIEDIKNAMEKLISDKNLRSKLENGAYERSKRFDWENISKMYLESITQ